MSKFTLKLDYDTVDDIVLQVLKEDYVSLKQSLAETKGLDLLPHQEADRIYDKKLFKALKRVLHSRMVHDDYVAFMSKENNS